MSSPSDVKEASQTIDSPDSKQIRLMSCAAKFDWERTTSWRSWPKPRLRLPGGRCGIRAQQLPVLSQEIMVGHSGNVITYDAMAGLALGRLAVRLRHSLRMIEIELEQLSQGFHGSLTVHHDGGLVVQPFEQELLERSVSRGHLR